MSTDADSPFAARYARWHALHRLAGPGRSYPHAWRLPELARAHGAQAVAQARAALALDLYTLGRFAEALTALPEGTRGEPLRQDLHLLLGLPSASPPSLYRHYLLGLPGPLPPDEAEPADDATRLWQDLLRQWATPCPDLASTHRTVAQLRALIPSLGAQAEALLAEIHYRLEPRWSVVWLDHALEQLERYSQHHLKARLMGLKARALVVAGELGEGARFRTQARALAERQGARLYLDRFIDPG